MENKELPTSVLNSMKEFKIIAHGNDEQIAAKILKVVKTELINNIDDFISSNNFDGGYVDGLNTACGIINDELS